MLVLPVLVLLVLPVLVLLVFDRIGSFISDFEPPQDISKKYGIDYMKIGRISIVNLLKANNILNFNKIFTWNLFQMRNFYYIDLQGLIGVTTIITLAYILSSNRRMIDWKTILIGLSSQFIIAIGVIKVDFVRKFLK